MYAETKERAIDAVRTKQTLEAITKKMASGNSPGFSSFCQGPTQRRPFYYQGNQNTGGWSNQQLQQFAPRALQQPQYTSTNALRWMNNMPVPMDLSYGRAPYNRGHGGGAPRGCTAQTGRPPMNLSCFNCGQQGHFVRNCPNQKRSNVNLIDAEEEEVYEQQEPMQPMQANHTYMNYNPGDKWDQVKAIVSTMSRDEQDEYIKNSKSKDFQRA